MRIEVKVNEFTKRGKLNQIMSDGEDFVYVEFTHNDNNDINSMIVTSYLFEDDALTFGYKIQLENINITDSNFWEAITVMMSQRNYILCENQTVFEFVGFLKTTLESKGMKMPHILIGKM